MKKIYFLVLASIACTPLLNAQNLAYPNGQHLTIEVRDTAYEAWQIDVTTPTAEDVTFTWDLISNTMPTSWDYALCDWTNCYVGIPSSGTMTPISFADAKDGTVGFFKINVTSGSTYADTKVEFYVYDSRDINRGDTVSFSIQHSSPLGVQEQEAISLLSFYPNPAHNTLTLKNTSAKTLNIEINNAIGQSVLSHNVVAGATSSLDVSALNRGVYFISYSNTLGQKNTRKLILN
ncbi:MAG: hypothetical protein ACI8ZO_000487 [Flavobacteriales bacterium]|jgi:hypothetical protein